MSYKVAIQMDPLADIDVGGDTSFALLLEAQARGLSLFFYQPQDLSFEEGVLSAPLAPLKVQDIQDKRGAHYELGAAQRCDLREMDVVLMRQDPPFDMGYIMATHFLEQIMGDVLVVNDPVSVRNMPEKLFALQFADLIAPTLIARERAAFAAFRKKHKDIILKPIFGNGGAGVFRVSAESENFNAFLDLFLAQSREPFMAQAYLPEIRKGDKRVILLDGEAVGAVNRLPRKGDARANLHVGGTAEAADLDARDLEIAARIGPALREAGILLAGIDVIGGVLTEINVTSPTGLREIKNLSGVDIAPLFWDKVTQKLSTFN